MTQQPTIVLYGIGPKFGLPEASPYVTKTEMQLKMAGLPYAKEAGAMDASPKGQLPYIDDMGARISDSTFIRAHLEARYGIDLDAGLDARERAQAWAIERMIENHLGWTAAYHRWLIPANFEKGPAQFFHGAPQQVRDDVVARIKANVFATGLGRHSEAEIFELGGRSLRALSDILGDRPWLMGARPCGTDPIAFAFLAGLMTPWFDSPLRDRALGFANLVAYVDRLMRTFYPQHPWTVGTDAEAVGEAASVCAESHIAEMPDL